LSLDEGDPNDLNCSLAELRARYREMTPSEEVLARLARDPRAGVRALVRQLARRAERATAEQRRVEALYARERSLAPAPGAHIAGVDEVGMGPLAGPVVAAAVVLAPESRLEQLDDSKRLRPETRRCLVAAIRKAAIAYAIGVATRAEIDRINIHQAGLLAMQRAVARLDCVPDLVAVDGRGTPELGGRRVTCIIGGDRQVACIAAASVLAKEFRDAWMVRLDRKLPGYGFARHMGYGTPEHLEALARLGPSSEHRRSFAPVREAAGRHNGGHLCHT